MCSQTGGDEMAWKYEYLPMEVKKVVFSCREDVELINCRSCPNHEKRPCKGLCCLGTNELCKENRCHNKGVSCCK